MLVMVFMEMSLVIAMMKALAMTAMWRYKSRGVAMLVPMAIMS